MRRISFRMNLFKRNKEEDIVNLFKQGNPQAMNKLYKEYADYLTGVCARYISDEDDLKDILQEGFIKIFTQISTFEYRGVGSLKAWMTKIIINEALFFLSREKIKTSLIENNLPDLPDEEPDIEGISADVIVRFIQELPAGYRAVFNLYVMEGKSHNEIAQILNIKADSSASQLHRAKNMLAQKINAYKTKMNNL